MSLVVMLMILIVSATVTMGWTSRPAQALGLSGLAESSDHVLHEFNFLNARQGDQTMPAILAEGGGNTCCACDRTDSVKLPGQSASCSAARISHAASLPQPLDLEPPQAPPRT